MIVMDMVVRYGQMEPNTKDIGSITKLMERVNLRIHVEIHMRVNGKKIKPVVMAYLRIIIAKHNIKEIGKMICSMAMELKYMLMEINIKVNIS